MALTKATNDNLNDEQEEFQLFLNNLCQETVTSLLASGNPSIQCPEDAIKYLFPQNYRYLPRRIRQTIVSDQVNQEQLDIAAKFGRFIDRPSDLFLKIFYNVICTLEHDPLVGCVSPKLIGSTGIICLTIISTIPDIMRYYSDVIIHAEKEILFSTMYWEKSESAYIINKAFRDLNKRANDENRHVIIKLIMDHPNILNTIPFHFIIPPNQWSKYDLPNPEEIPNISLEIQNYHRAILGTFHAKFIIIDRKFVLLNSNNIQDRPNLEMMSRYEGDIVNSFYDSFIISWSIPFQSNLLCLNDSNLTITSQDQFIHKLKVGARSTFEHFQIEETEFDFQENSSTKKNKKHSKYSLSSIAARIIDNSRISHPVTDDSNIRSSSQFSITEHLNKCSISARSTITDKNLSSEDMEILSLEFTPFLFHHSHQPFPIALVNRLPQGIPAYKNTINPQDAAWMSAFQYAQKSIFIQTPTLNASPAIDGIIGACQRGIKVTLWLNLGFNNLKEGHGTFQGGTNEYVVKKLYKQLRKINNGVEQNLEIFWYVAKDQKRPLHFSQKKRNCHIKFMSIDDQVAIMGNANMDSLSWFHSQEINTMIDSPMIVKDWMDTLYRNQATNTYGRLNNDGIWRDAQGRVNPKNGK